MTDKSQQRLGHLGKLQKHKLINILACGSVFSRLIGLPSERLEQATTAPTLIETLVGESLH